jgi:hypothetical protein
MLDSGAVNWETEAVITLHHVVSTNIQRQDLRKALPSRGGGTWILRYESTTTPTTNNDHPSKLMQTPPTINSDQAPLRSEEGSASPPLHAAQTAAD